MAMKEEYEQKKSKKNYIVSIYFGEGKSSCINDNFRENFKQIYKNLELCLKSKDSNYKIKSFDTINSFYISLEESELELFAKNLDECIREIKNSEFNKNIEYKIEEESNFSLY
jgi:hypothetical protein